MSVVDFALLAIGLATLGVFGGFGLYAIAMFAKDFQNMIDESNRKKENNNAKH